jgi:DNA polymerase-3 subunit delta'
MHGFSGLTGHEAVANRLRNALDAGRVHHAYLFAGEKGIGKKTLANAFAKALQCEHPPHRDECGCLSCRVFESGNHPDVIYVKGTKIKSIGADDIREQIVAPVSVKPFRYQYQIYIVDLAETITPQAQNILLKTIEEPPPHGIVLLLAAHTHNLLATVLSRCVTFKLAPLPDHQVADALIGRGVPPETAAAVAPFSRGNIGRALLYADSEDFMLMRELSSEISETVGGLGVNGALALFPRIEKWKESIQSLLGMLYLCYREKVTRMIGDAAVPLRNADAVRQAMKALQQNGNFKMTIEVLLLRLQER